MVSYKLSYKLYAYKTLLVLQYLPMDLKGHQNLTVYAKSLLFLIISKAKLEVH